MIIAFCLVLWYLSGVIPTYLFMHSRSDMKRADVLLLFCTGLPGPLAGLLVCGFVIMQWAEEGREVIIPKRRRP